MAKIQEQIEVIKGTAVIAAEESGLSAKRFFSSMSKWQKLAFFICAVLIIPGYFASFYVAKTITAAKYKNGLLAAHPAFAESKPISATPVKVFKISENQFTAYFQVTNNNLDLVAPEIPYSVDFYNAASEKVSSYNATFFLLPDQKKFIIVPRVSSTDEIVSAKLNITQAKWQKRLNIPDVSFTTPTPDVYDDDALPQLVVEGSVINKSAYAIQNIQIVFVLFDKSGNVSTVSARSENNIAAFGRRAYKQLWPGLQASQISKVQVFVDVNTLDTSNLHYEPAGSSSADNPELQ